MEGMKNTNEPLADCTINLSALDLPRDRDDLWYVSIHKDFDAFVTAVHFTLTGGLYVKFSKTPLPAFPDDLGGFKTRDFDKHGLLMWLVGLSRRNERTAVSLYGLSSYGERMSELAVECSDPRVVGETGDRIVVRFTPHNSELKPIGKEDGACACT